MNLYNLFRFIFERLTVIFDHHVEKDTFKNKTCFIPFSLQHGNIDFSTYLHIYCCLIRVLIPQQGEVGYSRAQNLNDKSSSNQVSTNFKNN